MQFIFLLARTQFGQLISIRFKVLAYFNKIFGFPLYYTRISLKLRFLRIWCKG